MQRTFSRLLAAATLAFASVAAAHAASFGASLQAGYGVTGYTGSGGGYAESATVGGSQASTGNYGTGYAVQFSSNDGYGYAGAGAAVTPTGTTTYTTGGSDSFAQSGGFTAGNGYGNTAGGVGTDFSSKSWGSFATSGFGGSFGGFAGLSW